jgi:hypothetical protein
MTFLDSGARVLNLGRADHFNLPIQKVAHLLTAAGRLRAGLEGFLLIALFLVLAGTALYLRARLGFAH